MAQYFKVVNLSKKQYFSIGDLGGSISLSGIGRGLNGIAFSRLLTSYGEFEQLKKIKSPNELTDGYWIGDQVAIVGDYDKPDSFELTAGTEENLYALTNSNEYEDITDKIIVWLALIGFEDEISEVASNDFNFLKRIGHLVFSMNLTTLQKALSNVLGNDWTQKLKGI